MGSIFSAALTTIALFRPLRSLSPASLGFYRHGIVGILVQRIHRDIPDTDSGVPLRRASELPDVRTRQGQRQLRNGGMHAPG